MVLATLHQWQYESNLHEKYYNNGQCKLILRNFPFYGQILSPGDKVVVSVVRGGKTDKRETFLSAFYCLESRDKDTDRYWLLDTLP